MARRLEYLNREGEWVPSMITQGGIFPGKTPDEKLEYLNALPTATKFRLAQRPQTR